jgi:hypothetical protein
MLVGILTLSSIRIRMPTLLFTRAPKVSTTSSPDPHPSNLRTNHWSMQTLGLGELRPDA